MYDRFCIMPVLGVLYYASVRCGGMTVKGISRMDTVFNCLLSPIILLIIITYKLFTIDIV